MRTVVRRAALTIAATLVAATATAADFRLLELGGFQVKWGEPRLGSRAEISYGFADGRRSFPDAINCRELEAAERLPVARGELAKVAAEAFRLWSAAAAVSFREARPGERPDILIGAQGRPEGIAFANVWPDRGRAHDRRGAAGRGDDLPQSRRSPGCRTPRVAGRPTSARCWRTRSATRSASTIRGRPAR